VVEVPGRETNLAHVEILRGWSRFVPYTETNLDQVA
jgi:hypothetical protein